MKFFLILLVLFCSFTFNTKAQETILLNDKIAFQESQHFIQKSAFTESASHSNTDFIYQRMEWEIDPAIRYISGEITTYFKSKTSNLTKLEFDLSEVLQIDSVTSNNKHLNYSRTADITQITLSTVLEENQIDSLTIYYRGIPPETGFGSFTIATHGTEKTPVLWTLSEPYGAKEWWPCKQSLTDKIDSIDIIVTTPEVHRTASNGILVSENVEAGKRIMHWKHRFPIATYLVAIAVTNYESYSDYLELDDDRQIEILNYVYPENLEKAKTETPVTANLINLFNTLVGEYPFANEKYGHAQFGWGGGMEHQTMSFMGNFSFGLIAHELAHQWFGDCITLGSWQHIWLNEGFATYLTGLAYENHEDKSHWSIWKEVYKNQVLSQPDGAVFVTDTTSISRLFDSRLSYSKGALILHMQRWILGDDIFFTALQNYFADEKIANSFAYSEEWISHIETAGDTSLTGFFDDWLYGEGYPTYSATFHQPAIDSVVFYLSQTTSHNSVDFFELPVPVRLYNSSKTDSADFRLNNTANNQEFILKTNFMVDKIVIDPDNWILCKTDQITQTPIMYKSQEIVVYPNPTTSEITIITPGGELITKTLLFTIEGKLLHEFGSTNTINLSNYSGGTYFIQTETTNSTFVKKIVKQ